MSIRYIGLQSYMPITPSKYAKTNVNAIKLSSFTNQNQYKSFKIKRYREELDKQLQQRRQRKLQARLKQKQQDQKRQRLFSQSLQYTRGYKNQQSNPYNNYHHMNRLSSQRYRLQTKPQHDRLTQQINYFNSQKRFDELGKNKSKIITSNLQSRHEIFKDNQDINDLLIERKRKQLLQKMDRSLAYPYLIIQRSKGQGEIDPELQRLKRRLNTQSYSISPDKYYSNQIYSSPYSKQKQLAYKFSHRRQPTRD